MRIEDIPADAWTLPPTPVPTKVVVVHDWQALHETLKAQGFVIIESDQIRKTSTGVTESVLVKNFSTYLYQTVGVRLRIKRINATRWYCTI
jgi:hypothetical protein